MSKDLAPQQKKALTPKQHFERTLEQLKPQIAKALARNVDPDRFARIALSAVSKNEKLLECTPSSLLGSIMESAALGLEVNTPLGQSYIVPYKGVATLIIGYRGMIHLALRSPAVSNVEARAVFKDDRFSWAYGLTPKLHHEPNQDSAGFEDPASLTHVYAIITFRDGRKTFDVMTRGQVEAIKKRSRAREDGPWVTDYVAMAKKTVLRRHLKTAPLTPEAARAVELDDRVDADLPQEFIDIEVSEPQVEVAPEEEGKRMSFRKEEPGAEG